MNTEKILVFSDSHGSDYVMKALLADPPAGLCAVFHLGDGAEGAERLMRNYPMYAYIGVKGNCDPFGCSLRETVVTDRGGVRFMLTHGHVYGVKSSMLSATVAALENGADVLLYGHTHIKDDRDVSIPSGSVRMINPGSARNADYALITIEDGAVSVELLKYEAKA